MGQSLSVWLELRDIIRLCEGLDPCIFRTSYMNNHDEARHNLTWSSAFEGTEAKASVRADSLAYIII
jgi:hypothetical protein